MTGERRADHRIFLHSSVEITGVDDAGRQFAERSRLEDVGNLGCRFSMQNAVHPGGILGIEPLGPQPDAAGSSLGQGMENIGAGHRAAI